MLMKVNINVISNTLLSGMGYSKGQMYSHYLQHCFPCSHKMASPEKVPHCLMFPACRL